MQYIRVQWIHSLPAEPITLLSELDDQRYEVRKLELFANGTAGRASRKDRVGSTRLGKVPMPSLEEINSDPQFRAEEISQVEFEAAWRAHK